MAREIERKFLVRRDLWYAVKKPDGKRLRQGYLVAGPELAIRVRITENSAFLTIKGSTRNMTRDEFEYPIPPGDAVEIFNTLTRNSLEKIRFTIDFGGNTWVVDEFLGKNEGLILAEIELESENQEFDRPSWLGEEVTSDSRYYNSYLAEKPFSTWT